MEWSFEYTKQDMQAFTEEVYRRSKASSVVLWVLSGFTGLFGLRLLWTGLWPLVSPHGYHGGYVDGLAKMAMLGTYLTLALVFFALTGWILHRATPRQLAKRASDRAARRTPEALGPEHVALSETQLLICQGGAQQASDPSVIHSAVLCDAGVLIYLHDKKRVLALPGRLFEDKAAMHTAAQEFERCGALAKAALLERKAQELAGSPPQWELPPQPPLPEGEAPQFALPVRLQRQELFEAIYGGNRSLKPTGWLYKAAWIFLVVETAMGLMAAAQGDIAYSLLMFAVALVVALVPLSRAPFVIKNSVRQVIESEQAQRLLTPGWLVLGQQGFTNTSGSLCSYVPYEQVNRVAQSERYLFILYQGNLLLTAPKRGFESPVQAAQAFAFLQQKTMCRKGK